MHHFFFIVFSLLAIIGQHVSSAREHRSVLLSVPNGGPWGTWFYKNMCPSGAYAVGFSLRVERALGDADDTALNAIRLHCVDRSKGVLSLYDYTSIVSGTGYWGEWTSIKWCPSGYLTAFQLRVESPQGSEDDTAANNIQFMCSDGIILEGDGTDWGEWGKWSSRCEGRGICGLNTRIEEQQGDDDDTALNDVLMYCCD